MKELLDFNTPTQVRVDTCTTAQEPELCAEKGTQVSVLPERKIARVQTSQRTKTVGKFTKSLISTLQARGLLRLPPACI